MRTGTWTMALAWTVAAALPAEATGQMRRGDLSAEERAIVEGRWTDRDHADGWYRVGGGEDRDDGDDRYDRYDRYGRYGRDGRDGRNDRRDRRGRDEERGWGWERGVLVWWPGGPPGRVGRNTRLLDRDLLRAHAEWHRRWDHRRRSRDWRKAHDRLHRDLEREQRRRDKWRRDHPRW